MGLNRIIKPKNQRVKRALDKREPKLHENDKNAVFIKGGQTTDTVTQVLKELALLKKPLSTVYQRKNATRPFDDQTSVEFFANKSDSSLFLFGSHSKKRPNNLVLGRLFDGHVLDMFEFGIDNFKSMKDFLCPKSTLGTKPCLIFAGEAFEGDDVDYKRLKNLLIDFYRGPSVSQIRLSGLEHVYFFTAAHGKLYLRSYRVVMKKSGSRVPRVELDEMGPSLNLTVRRTKIASIDAFKQARRQPKAAKVKKTKNISKDALGTQHGRVHMQTQDIAKLQTRKMKGLKRKTWTMEPATDASVEPASVEPASVELTITDSEQHKTKKAKY